MRSGSTTYWFSRSVKVLISIKSEKSKNRKKNAGHFLKLDFFQKMLIAVEGLHSHIHH